MRSPRYQAAREDLLSPLRKKTEVVEPDNTFIEDANNTNTQPDNAFIVGANNSNAQLYNEEEDEDEEDEDETMSTGLTAVREEPSDSYRRVEGEEREEEQEEEEEEEEEEAEEEEVAETLKIDESNKDVQALMKDMLDEIDIEDIEVEINYDRLVEILHDEISKTEQQALVDNPTGPMYGGWIVDNFPMELEAWRALLEANTIHPDQLIELEDLGDELLVERWFHEHKKDLEESERQRKAEEKSLFLEAQRLRLEQERLAAEEEEEEEEDEEEEEEEEVELTDEERMALNRSKLASVIRRRSVMLDEFKFHDVTLKKKKKKKKKKKGKKTAQKQVEETEEADEDEDEDDDDGVDEEEDDDERELWPGPGLPDIPELRERRSMHEQYHTAWDQVNELIQEHDLSDLVLSVSLLSEPRDEWWTNQHAEPKPQPIDMQQLADNVIDLLKKPVSHVGWARTEQDEQEEEEGREEGEGEEGEEGGEETGPAEPEEDLDDQPEWMKKKALLGDTGRYCPVALSEQGVLRPGDPDLSAKYRDKIYYFSDEPSRERFIENPRKFLTKHHVNPAPPLRLLLLGPVGAGKTLQGRQLAERLGLFHIQFRERLQELVMKKMKRKVGAEYDDDQEEPLELPAESLFGDDDDDDDKVDDDDEGVGIKEINDDDDKVNEDDVISEKSAEVLVAPAEVAPTGNVAPSTELRSASVTVTSLDSAKPETEAGTVAGTVTGTVTGTGTGTVTGTGRGSQAQRVSAKSDLEAMLEIVEQINEMGEVGEGEGEGEEGRVEEEQVVEEEDMSDELTEDEQAIVNYLESDEPLPYDLLANMLRQWWHDHPFKSVGFVLEGFPSTVEEAEMLVELGLYPDGAVVLETEEEDVMARLLPGRMSAWREKRARLLEYRNRVREIEKRRRERVVQKRRKELLTDLNQRRIDKLTRRSHMDAEEAASSSVKRKSRKPSTQSGESELSEQVSGEKRGDDDDDDDEEDEDDDDNRSELDESIDMEQEMENIDAILAEEFPEEDDEEGTDDETEEEAKERIGSALFDRYDKSMSQLNDVKDKLIESDIKIYNIEAARRRPHIISYLINKKLRPIIDLRSGMFENVQPIGEKTALQLIKLGYKQLSRFGRWCPVKLLEGDWLPPLWEPGVTVTYPAVYRRYIYFFSSKQAREDFRADPFKFLQQPSPKPHVPIRIAVVGPPKSGKSTVCERFVRDFGCVRVSMGDALRTVLSTQPNTSLARQIRGVLESGGEVPDELAVRALQVVLMNPRCHERGYVLDGYPVTKAQAMLMDKLNIVPTRTIELQVPSKELSERAALDRNTPSTAVRELPAHDSADVFGIKLTWWRSEIVDVRNWYTTEHDNWSVIDGTRSKWWVWNQTREITKQAVMRVATYMDSIKQGKAVCLAGMCISPAELKARLSEFGQYCPVSLAECKLVDGSHSTSLQYAAEYKGYYYKMAGPEELEKFLSTPDKYVPPLAPRSLPPEHLRPKRITAAEVRTMFPAPLQLRGYCPVTFYEGRGRYEAIVPGNPELVVQFKNKIYYFETEEKLEMFMRRPHRYSKQKLPHKLPPKREPMTVGNLPMLGYLEQTVADAIIKSLLAVGTLKPKFPFVSATRSALVYMAFHLKANNANSTEYTRKKFAKKLENFEEACDLIGYLSHHMTKRFKDTRDRPIDFDFKLNKFIEYSNTSPEAYWVS